jgi:hypothetical protein
MSTADILTSNKDGESPVTWLTQFIRDLEEHAMMVHGGQEKSQDTLQHL